MSKPRRTITQFTYDIEEFIYYIKQNTKDLSYEEFVKNRIIIDSVEINVLKIGEAVSQIQKLDKEILYKVKNDKSYWEDIKGTRNRIVHEYWGTSIEVLYEIATTKELDELLECVLKMRELEEE